MLILTVPGPRNITFEEKGFFGKYFSKIFSEKKDNLDKPPMDLFPGWAKRMAELQIKAYQTQYKLKNMSIVRPSNIYGPGDNFDEKNAMVIPSLISKITKAKNNTINVWGDGKAERDFLFSTDCGFKNKRSEIVGNIIFTDASYNLSYDYRFSESFNLNRNNFNVQTKTKNLVLRSSYIQLKDFASTENSDTEQINFGFKYNINKSKSIMLF